MPFPTHRLRRLRRSPAIRRLVRETSLGANDFIFPLFIPAGNHVEEPLPAIPGMSLLAGEPLLREARQIVDLGIPAVLLFGIPEAAGKDEIGTLAWDPEGPVQRALRTLKSAVPDLVLIADLCLCEYTNHGHCGVYRDGEIDNDCTLESIRKIAVSYAEAGADVIAPSGMMDGTVHVIRGGLDQAGHSGVLVMPYSAKFATTLYGPFKLATKSKPAESLHNTHQLDPANGRQALLEIEHDIAEGADLCIVKPAGPSLDIIAAARSRFDLPISAYQVSGEYNMLWQAAAGDEARLDALMLESLTCIKRAGADTVVTYFSKRAAKLLL